MTRTRAGLSIAVVAALLLTGCTAGSINFGAVQFGPVQFGADLQSTVRDGQTRADTEASGTWTVLVYSIADTNLESPLLEDLTELASVGGRDGLEIVAMVDRAAGYSSEPLLGLPNWTGAKVLEIGRNSATELADLGDVNTGDPRVLADFIRNGIQAYPAQHYALVISDHGASWPGVGGDLSSGHDVLVMSELEQALDSALDGLAIGTLDLIGFDACLMATYEVASALAPYANRLVASQELEPGHGWDYAAFDEITDDGKATVDELASSIIDGFRGQSVSYGTDAAITLSNVDLTRMGELEAAMAEFTGILIERAEQAAPAVGKSLAQTLGFGTNPNLAYDTHMKDLGILVAEVGIQLLFASDAADNIIRSINDLVLDKVDGQATIGATGLSIYFPPTSQYYDTGYDDLEVAGGWADFLAAYYTEGDGIPVGQVPQLSDPQLTVGPSAATIQAQFDPALTDSISEAWIRYGIVDAAGEITYLGEQDAAVREGRAIGTYGLTTLRLTDGASAFTAYAALYPDKDAGVNYLSVPLYAYDATGAPAGEVILSGVIQMRTNEVLTMTYYLYDEGTGTYGEYVPDPGSTIRPQALLVHPDGEWEWSVVGDSSIDADPRGLRYSWERVPAGTVLQLDLIVTDFGGNSDSVSGTVTVG